MFTMQYNAPQHTYNECARSNKNNEAATCKGIEKRNKKKATMVVKDNWVKTFQSSKTNSPLPRQCSPVPQMKSKTDLFNTLGHSWPYVAPWSIRL